MTDVLIIGHRRKGSREALDAARLLADDGKYERSLFHCHLAVDKSLKAAIMESTKQPHPKVHDLGRLALLIKDEWPAEDRNLFGTLSDFAISARYDDPTWAERHATEANARLWIDRKTDSLTNNLT